MTRVPASLMAAAAVLALAACADSTSKVTAPSDLQPSYSQAPDELNTTGYKKIMKLKDEGEADAKQAQKDAADEAKDALRANRRSGTGISYHGGPILVTTNIAAIFWATGTIFTGQPAPGTSSASNAGDQSVVGDFLRGLGGSPYFNINTTYYNASNVYVQNSVTYTQYWANNSVVAADNSTTTVSDGQMLSMLQTGFNTGKLTYNANTLYAIFTPGKVNLGGGFGGSNFQYCAYHGSGNVTVGGLSKVVLYAAMPYDYAYPSYCTSGYPTDDADRGAATEVNTLAHELEETTTDGYGNAWWDSRGYENADKCAWMWGSISTSSNGGKYNMIVGGHKVLVQQNWKNVIGGGCATSF